MQAVSPGEIQIINISEGPVIIQKKAFLAAQPSVKLATHISIQIGDDQNSGNFVFQRLSGDGIAFVAIGGSLIERTLNPSEIINANIANVAAFEESIAIQTKLIDAFKNMGSGGGGMLLATLTGPGKVWLQTLTAHR